MRPALLLAALLAGAAVADGPAPAPRGRLCAGFGDDGAPVAAPERFPWDAREVALLVEEPRGASPLRAEIATPDGAVVLSEEGPGPRFRVPVAGRAWARRGGAFRMRLRVPGIPEPLLDLPFEILPAPIHALLVGIRDYPPKGPERDLPGCDLDVARMEALLRDAYGVPPERISVLRDLDATRDAIEAGLVALGGRAGPDEAALFYFSGHGAQLPDLDGDEEDGWDEALVPADEKPRIFTTDAQLRLFLSDDRIGEILRGFRTRNVTVLFDSCHAGTAVREAEAVPPPPELFVARTLEFSFGKRLRDLAGAARDGAAAGRRDDGFGAAQGRVFLAACRPWELSGCGPEQGGFFSSTLLPLLLASDGEPWESILARATPALLRLNPAQTPGVEGAGRRLPFSLAEAPSEAPYVRPTIAVAGAVPAAKAAGPRADEAFARGEAGAHVALLSGLSPLFGEQAGAEFDAHPAGAAAFDPEAKKARLALTARSLLRGGTGYAVAEIRDGSVALGDRLLPRTVRVPRARPRVAPFLRDDADPDLFPLAKAIRERFEGDALLELATDGGRASLDYVLEPRRMNGAVATIVWTSTGGMLATFETPEGGPAALAARAREFLLRRHGRFGRVVRVHNPSPPFRLEALAEGGERARVPGKPVPVRVAVSEEAFVAVLAAEEGGEFAVVARPEAAVRPGAPCIVEVPLPAADSKPRRVAVKVLATKRRMEGLPAGACGADRLLEALRESLGGAEGDFLPTDGWADSLLFLVSE